MQRAGIKSIKVHGLRHTSVTLLLRPGYSLMSCSAGSGIGTSRSRSDYIAMCCPACKRTLQRSSQGCCMDEASSAAQAVAVTGVHPASSRSLRIAWHVPGPRREREPPAVETPASCAMCTSRPSAPWSWSLQIIHFTPSECPHELTWRAARREREDVSHSDRSLDMSTSSSVKFLTVQRRFQLAQ